MAKRKTPIEKVIDSAVDLLDAWDKSDGSKRSENVIAKRVERLATAITDLLDEGKEA